VIEAIDHVVLTTRDEVKCIEFYTQVLGMHLERYGNNRLALRFGRQKINVHQPGVAAGLKAQFPTPGSLDLCFLASVPIEAVMTRLRQHGISIIEGPVIRAGAVGSIRSVYVRDPDENLIEISETAA
jgi:catechol 2,3-dioxygenase-like lactoylglutathione lyase family enzyme